MLLVQRADGRVQPYVGRTTRPKDRLRQHRQQPPLGIPSFKTHFASLSSCLKVLPDVHTIALSSILTFTCDATYVLQECNRPCLLIECALAMSCTSHCKWYHLNQQMTWRRDGPFVSTLLAAVASMASARLVIQRSSDSFGSGGQLSSRLAGRVTKQLHSLGPVQSWYDCLINAGLEFSLLICCTYITHFRCLSFQLSSLYS
jgi:hypothetical protein